MSINQIKEELSKMAEDQQDQLAAYLVHLRHLRDPQARKEMATRIDDKHDSNWVTLDQLKKHWKE
jgi:hypothetical protein